MQYIVCFGKQLLPDNTPDWFLESRLALTATVAGEHPEAKVILTGGRSVYLEADATQPSEAKVMAEFMATRIAPERILTETESANTAEQILLLIKKYFLQENVAAIFLVSDEFHLPRVKNLFQAMYRDQDKVTFCMAPVRLSGNYFKFLKTYLFTQIEYEAEAIKLLPQYDLDAFTKYTQAYLRMRKLDPDQQHLFDVNDIMQEAGLPYRK